MDFLGIAGDEEWRDKDEDWERSPWTDAPKAHTATSGRSSLGKTLPDEQAAGKVGSGNPWQDPSRVHRLRAQARITTGQVVRVLACDDPELATAATKASPIHPPDKLRPMTEVEERCLRAYLAGELKLSQPPNLLAATHPPQTYYDILDFHADYLDGKLYALVPAGVKFNPTLQKYRFIARLMEGCAKDARAQDRVDELLEDLKAVKYNAQQRLITLHFDTEEIAQLWVLQEFKVTVGRLLFRSHKGVDIAEPVDADQKELLYSVNLHGALALSANELFAAIQAASDNNVLRLRQANMSGAHFHRHQWTVVFTSQECPTRLRGIVQIQGPDWNVTKRFKFAPCPRYHSQRHLLAHCKLEAPRLLAESQIIRVQRGATPSALTYEQRREIIMGTANRAPEHVWTYVLDGGKNSDGAEETGVEEKTIQERSEEGQRAEIAQLLRDRGAAARLELLRFATEDDEADEDAQEEGDVDMPTEGDDDSEGQETLVAKPRTRDEDVHMEPALTGRGKRPREASDDSGEDDVKALLMLPETGSRQGMSDGRRQASMPAYVYSTSGPDQPNSTPEMMLPAAVHHWTTSLGLQVVDVPASANSLWFAAHGVLALDIPKAKMSLSATVRKESQHFKRTTLRYLASIAPIWLSLGAISTDELAAAYLPAEPATTPVTTLQAVQTELYRRAKEPTSRTGDTNSIACRLGLKALVLVLQQPIIIVQASEDADIDIQLWYPQTLDAATSPPKETVCTRHFTREESLALHRACQGHHAFPLTMILRCSTGAARFKPLWAPNLYAAWCRLQEDGKPMRERLMRVHAEHKIPVVSPLIPQLATPEHLRKANTRRPVATVVAPAEDLIGAQAVPASTSATEVLTSRPSVDDHNE